MHDGKTYVKFSRQVSGSVIHCGTEIWQVKLEDFWQSRREMILHRYGGCVISTVATCVCVCVCVCVYVCVCVCVVCVCVCVCGGGGQTYINRHSVGT